MTRQHPALLAGCPLTPQGAGAKQDGQPYFLSKYKTQLCIYFERQGYCT